MSSGPTCVVIAGGGLAAARTAQALREVGFNGPILLISAESVPPYDRPPLSKGVLLGKLEFDQISLLKTHQAIDLAIDYILGSTVIDVDRGGHVVTLSDGKSIGYGKLVVATGARPSKLPQFNGFGNVHMLRNLDNALRLRQALVPGARIGIVGAGFIGLEIASVARELGCEVDIVEMAPTPLAAILGRELGGVVQCWHERQGVRFHCGIAIAGVEGKNNVETLRLSDGTSVDVDAVVVGVGQVPNVDWLTSSGLEIQRGLVCDAHGRTEDPDVFVVGDAACIKVGAEYMPTRHWTATTEQARKVAQAIAGSPDTAPVVHDHYFWSDQYGKRLQFAGHVPPDPVLHWVSGGPDEDRFVVLLGDGIEVTAVFSLGNVKDFLLHSMPLRRGERVEPPASQAPLAQAG